MTSPEITWSIMHPVKPDPGYMRQVIAAAADYHVDSFEVCGDVHSSTGSIDGAIRFRDYPAVTARLDLPALDVNIATLRTIAALAHESKRPIYYWHREVMVPREVVESVPGLLDEDGEFNLLGPAYQQLLRSKIAEFFENVPEMDGLVLTVTESEYSVIHNSNPRRYPPALVIKHVITTFAEELKRLNRRFILRSFGSIAQDYEDILKGAQAVESEFAFEIETKITPYDFSPFLPLNHFLKRTGSAALSAEYDSIGEFLGAGYLPAADPERVIECVAHATAAHVDRHVIRIDRIGHATFNSAQAIHLMAFDRAIRQPGVTAASLWESWANARWPTCATEMTQVMKRGIEVVKKTHFIDGHVIFHAFPIDADMKWIKACGILSVFQPHTDLNVHDGMWGILRDRHTPERAAILEEKDEAVRIAAQCLETLSSLRERLAPEEFTLAETAWKNAVEVTRLIRNVCRCVCAYFDDMDAHRPNHPSLTQAIIDCRPDFERVLRTALPIDPAAREKAVRTPKHEYGDYDHGRDCIEDAYARPIWKIILALRAEYVGELGERLYWRAQSDLVDFVVPGGIADDCRVQRYMHASHARLIDGRPARAAGNRVFPNGFIQCALAVPPHGRCRLVIKGDPAASTGFSVNVNGQTLDVNYAGDGTCELNPILAAGTRYLIVRLQKRGASYPWIFGVATFARPA